MRNWNTLTPEEKKTARAKFHFSYKLHQFMDDNVKKTKELLKDEPLAQKLAGKVLYGNYLINTPEEIAVYCRQKVSER